MPPRRPVLGTRSEALAWKFSQTEEYSSISGRTAYTVALARLRSQQQGEILALLLGDPELELSLTEIAKRTPYAASLGLPGDPAG